MTKDDTMRATVLGLVPALFLSAVVERTFSELEGERHVKSCEPRVLPRGRGTLRYPSPNSRLIDYDRDVDCEWIFEPSMLRPGVPSICDRMIATVELLDTEKDGDTLAIVDTSTGEVFANLSGQSLGSPSPGFPKQYVACSHRLTIRFKSNNNLIRGNGFRISYSTDSAYIYIYLIYTVTLY